MEKSNIRSKRSMNIKTSIKFDNKDLDEYKRDVEQSVTRRLYSPQVESLARNRPSLTKDDFVPREGQVSNGKLYDPYTDQMINSWQETSFGQQFRRAENYEMNSRSFSKHSRANSANESLMTKTNDSNRRKDVTLKEVTNPNLEALTLLTKELVQLEKKVSEASDQFSKGMNGDNSDSIINIYDENFWQEKISLHLSLANKYFEYIHLNYPCSVKKDIETKCWKHGFYLLIEQFRQAITLNKHRSKNRSSLSFVTLNKFNMFLNEAELFYKRLLKQIANDTKLSKSIEKNKPPRWIRCVSCLGDITRYRWNYGIEDQEKAKEFWAKSASRWYRLGIHLNSNNGQDELRTLYYYCRSLMVNTPFMNARESLVALFEANRQLVVSNVKQKPKGKRGYLQKDNLKTRNYLDNQSCENIFVRLHGMLFTKIGLESFDENFQIFLDKLFKMSVDIQDTDSTNCCWMKFYLFLAVINLSSLYNYGNNEKSTIGQAIKLQIKKEDDMEPLDIDPAFAQESRITFIIMNQFMSKYLEFENFQDEPEVTEGWLLYCEIILLWMVASGIFNSLTDASNNSVWRSVIRKLIFPGTWGILARFITKIIHQIPPLIKEKILDSVNCDPEQKFIQIQPPPLTEDWELRGISLLQSIYQHNLFESASKLNINFVDSDVDDIINIPNVENNFSLDQDEKIRRRVRIMELGCILTKKVNGFDFDIKEDLFTASSELNKNMESEDDDILHQTSELSIDEDENDILRTTESTFEEYSEDDDEGIMELKSRRQELETLLAVSRNDVHNYKSAKFSSKKYRKVKRTFSEKKESSVLCRVAPGYTKIVVDTNYLIGDLEMVKKLIKSEKWIIVVPLVVITELDGLKLNPSPLGHAASEALIYLNEIIYKSKKIKIQTSKGNYLPSINFSEEFDFGDGEDKKKNLDDLILGICLWHAKHHENHGTRDKSNEERNKDHKNEVVVLLTNDRNLRVKARARGVDVVGVNDFTGLI
ncbi:1867_t:CDS:2 [Funneliformis geosporum]|uniref:13510_t:CDS:1 n=1 Tax=Funneliformis geosporum TaxID=1117311 RepID=A0A9W4WRX0_9GLOM|nr:13510_t:CDS:2 [Funneliformis geosporum]CAI2167796.1 1867_t:CDS:2 [Funneliformis geosporum]